MWDLSLALNVSFQFNVFDSTPISNGLFTRSAINWNIGILILLFIYSLVKRTTSFHSLMRTDGKMATCLLSPLDCILHWLRVTAVSISSYASPPGMVMNLPLNLQVLLLILLRSPIVNWYCLPTFYQLLNQSLMIIQSNASLMINWLTYLYLIFMSIYYHRLNHSNWWCCVQLLLDNKLYLC